MEFYHALSFRGPTICRATHWQPQSVDIRVFATNQILLGWKTCKYYYETDELPNPRPTQPPKKLVESGTWATFSHSKYFFVGWDWSYIGNTDYKKPNPTKLSANTLLCCLRQQSVHWTVSVHGVHYCVGRGWLGAEKMARKVCPLRVCNLRR